MTPSPAHPRFQPLLAVPCTAVLACALVAPTLLSPAPALAAKANGPSFIHPKEVADDESLLIDLLEAGTGGHAAPMLSTPSVDALGVHLRWRPVVGAEGYRVYRKQAKKSKWKRLADLDAQRLSYNDTSLMPATTYRYAIVATCAGHESHATAPFRVKVPAVAAPTSIKLKTGPGSVNVYWQSMFTVDGFDVQYATNRFFHGARRVTLYEDGSEKLKIKKPSRGKTLYVRIRAFKFYGGKTSYSAWGYNKSVKKTATYDLSSIKTLVKVKKTVKTKKGASKGKAKAKTVTVTRKMPFELRSKAGQKLFGYDTMQGSCSDGTYAYFVLYNRTVEKGKIAKVRLRDLHVVKVSKALSIEHGNSLTYNSRSKLLVAAHTSIHRMTVSTISPKSLKVKKRRTVKVPPKLKGASKRQARSTTGILALTYCPGSRDYVAVTRGSHNLLVLDSKFKAKRYVTLKRKPDQIIQGATYSGGFLLVAEAASKAGDWNRISVYDRSGKYYGRMKLRNNQELEGVFFARGKLYAGFYKSGSRTSKGKTSITRDNYLYRIKGF